VIELNFSKMQALGNDFCVFGSPADKKQPDAEFIRALCDRHYGVGCDCAVFIGHSETADYFMHVYNPNGFEAEICGNALRCSAKYVCDNGYFTKRLLNVQTKSGVSKVSVVSDSIITEIGTAKIIESDFLNIAGIGIPFVSVSLGNPHCVIFVKNLSDEEFAFLGKSIENNPRFENGTNVEFAFISSPDSIEMRVWERGIGETMSCSTGSCACVAAANHLGKDFNKCDVIQQGGTITVTVNENGSMTAIGDCKTVFRGSLTK
jgi:diaminopimelate epimerase